MPGRDIPSQAHRGWDSSFDDFKAASRSVILESLRRNYPNTTPAEIDSWRRSIPILQKEVGQVVQIDAGFSSFSAILEYKLPMESRRTDALLLLHDGVVVIELKGREFATDSDIDQAHAYARDLKNYHGDCHNRKVTPILIPTRMQDHCSKNRNDSVYVCSPDRLDALVAYLSTRQEDEPINPDKFLLANAYKPLPSLVEAARKLFNEQEVPQVWKSVANTDRAVTEVRNIIAGAYQSQSRRLVLVAGVPGAGKTLVGLRVVHMPEIDGLVATDQRPASIFLSGNAPLVDVLQYVLRPAKGAGGTFVRHIRDYVETHLNPRRFPNERVVVFDEAQRAHDPGRVAIVQGIPESEAQSEPAYFVNFAERNQGWSVIVGLIGSGQEIHVGEEAGMQLWADAIKNCRESDKWVICGPQEFESYFSDLQYQVVPELSLDVTIRSHFATELHQFIDGLLQDRPDTNQLKQSADKLQSDGHDLWVTRDLNLAKEYLMRRYESAPDKRYGMMASSRDNYLRRIGIPNDYLSTRVLRLGPWYNDSEFDERALSCRHLQTCITEFQAQGLELDAVLLAWGTDFIFEDKKWCNSNARGYRAGTDVRDPLQLRRNAYRVLLTRGRDAHVVFVPPVFELNETWELLVASGFRTLSEL